MMQIMQLTWSQRINLIAVPLALTMLVLSIPMSSTAKSIFLALSVVLILITPAYYNDLRDTLSKPWCQSALLLFMLAAFGCIWSPASSHEKMLVLEKYSKLLYLPILAVGFRDNRTRQLALHAFLLAMTITCLMSILKDIAYIRFNGLDPGHVFRNHIMTGYMMAFAAYLSAILSVRAEGKRRYFYILLALLFSYQVIFVNTGRTGYVIYILLLGLFFLQHLSMRRAMLAAIMSVLLLGSTLYYNTSMQERVYQVVKDWNQYQQQDNKDTAIGYRLQFHRFAKTLFYQHPVAGNGTGSFTYRFALEKPVPSWDRRLFEPHSQYWLTASEFGVIGLLALGFFFLGLFWTVMQLNAMRAVALAVLLPFLAGNVSDSLLFYSGTGYLFIVFIALCLGESLSRKDKGEPQ